MVRSVADSKTEKLRSPDFDKYPQNLLLIYDNMPLPRLDHDMVMVHCVGKLNDYWSEGLHFDVIFLESGKIMLKFDSGGVQKFQINDVWQDAQ